MWGNFHILLNAFWAHNVTEKGNIMQSLPYLMNLALPFLISSLKKLHKITGLHKGCKTLYFAQKRDYVYFTLRQYRSHGTTNWVNILGHLHF